MYTQWGTFKNIYILKIYNKNQKQFTTDTTVPFMKGNSERIRFLKNINNKINKQTNKKSNKNSILTLKMFE